MAPLHVIGTRTQQNALVMATWMAAVVCSMTVDVRMAETAHDCEASPAAAVAACGVLVRPYCAVAAVVD